MTFEDALAAAAADDIKTARQFFPDGDQAAKLLSLNYQDCLTQPTRSISGRALD